MAGRQRGLGRLAPAGRFVVPALVATVMAGALHTTTSGPLYAEVYPTIPPPTVGGPGLPKLGNNLTVEQFVADADRAFAKAKVLVDTTPSRVVENTPTKLTARVVLGRSNGPPAAPEIDVAWENEAQLAPDEKDAVEVSPAQPLRKSLDDCSPRADGGCEVAWTWTIVARETGRQSLVLTIQPIVYVNGQPSEGFKKRNEPIAIDVVVHPVAKEFQTATADLTRVRLDVPDTVTTGTATTVTATLPRSWGAGDDLRADIQLATGPGSVSATIRPVRQSPGSATALTRAWTVEPTEAGVLTLVFTAGVSGKAGDEALAMQVPLSRDIAVGGTVWDRVGGLVVWLGGLVTLALGLIALARYWRDRGTGVGSP